MDFAVPVDHTVKIKENEKKDRNSDLANELKKNSVTVTLIVNGVLVTVSKDLEKKLKELEIGGQIEHCWDLTEF